MSELEKRGTRAGLLTAEGFIPLAEGMLAGLGLPRRVLVRLPKESLTDYESEEWLRRMADDALPIILSQLCAAS